MRPGGNGLVYLVIYIIVPKIAGSGESVRKKYKHLRQSTQWLNPQIGVIFFLYVVVKTAHTCIHNACIHCADNIEPCEH